MSFPRLPGPQAGHFLAPATPAGRVLCRWMRVLVLPSTDSQRAETFFPAAGPGKVLRKKSGYHFVASEINSENQENLHAASPAESEVNTLFSAPDRPF
jgi:hypothetical protein